MVTVYRIALLDYQARTHNKMVRTHGSASRMSETQASQERVSPALAMTGLSSRQRAEGRTVALEG